MYKPINQRLLTPGPMSLKDNVKNAMLCDLGSRTEDFRRVSTRVQNKLLLVAGAERTHDVVMLPGSGTTMIEAVFSSFLDSRHEVLVCINGIYGRRAFEILQTLGMKAHAINQDFGKRICVESVRKALRANPKITHLYFVHVETTFGILNPYNELLALARENGLFSIIDSMSAFGAEPVSGLRDGYDILITSGNKCIEAPPGVAFAFLSKRLLAMNDVIPQTYALNLKHQLATFKATQEWRFTPPTHVIQAVDAALDQLLLEGVHCRKQRYGAMATELVDRLRTAGFLPLLQESDRFPVCVSFSTKFIRSQADFLIFYELLEKNGLHIYAAMDSTTKSFRIGCIGAIESKWIDNLVDCAHAFSAQKSVTCFEMEKLA